MSGLICKGPIPDGLAVHYYLSTTQFPDLLVTTDDGGTFTFGMTSGESAGDYSVEVAHALYGEWEGDLNQSTVDVTQCTFLTDEPDGITVSGIGTDIVQLQDFVPPAPPAPPRPAVPVPVNQGPALLGLSLMLLLVGLYVGWRSRTS